MWSFCTQEIMFQNSKLAKGSFTSCALTSCWQISSQLQVRMLIITFHTHGPWLYPKAQLAMLGIQSHLVRVCLLSDFQRILLLSTTRKCSTTEPGPSLDCICCTPLFYITASVKTKRLSNALLISLGREYMLILDEIRSTIFPEATEIKPGMCKPIHCYHLDWLVPWGSRTPISYIIRQTIPPNSCISLRKFLKLSGSQFLHLENRDNKNSLYRAMESIKWENSFKIVSGPYFGLNKR